MQIALIVSSIVVSTAASDCVAEYGLCDTGAPCCNATSTCHVFKDNVAQCLPSSSTHAVHVRDAASGQNNGACATTWSQCNGQNWPVNSVCCANAGDECIKHNNYYSQCIPKAAKTSVTTTSPTTSPSSSNVQCSENWSQCNGQNWSTGVCCKDPSFQCHRKSEYVSVCEPKDPKKAAEASCTNVSVVGDATYCVQGAICGDQGDVCPKKGEYAVERCIQTLASYVGATKCVAPVDATCQKLPSGARGCVFGAVPAATTTTTTDIPAATTGSPATTGTAIPATTAVNNGGKCSTNWSQCNGQNWPYGVCCENADFQCNRKNEYLSLCEPKQPKKDASASCTNVSVVGDATYCVQGNICGDQGDVCPKKDDLAVGDCIQTLKSFVGATSKCVAPADAVCQKLPSGARGCVFSSGAAATTTGTPANTTSAPATTSVNTNTGKCSTKWSQCNGQNWPYGVCCDDAAFSCNYKNQYLSLCEPNDPKKAAGAASGVVAVWQQCGGKTYQGPTQCSAGNTCEIINDWYAQCKPSPTKEGVLATWARCGGIGYTGLTKCRDENKCLKYNDYYSQCVPL
ncbi:hypothetical protein DYB36_006189 [Aphanomyces astaci]|uniref:CBM1 domain-containing protein n=1 Tax=Aphanomyces astaci TaxID=112090 RepID=A0A397ASZ0_APHAT|nr:hypothetical protein DYB36_006189 [Aphanomyces astaci]